MASLKIPERYKLALLELAKFPSESWSSLYAALGQAQPMLDGDALVRSVASSSKDLSQDDLEPIIFVLMSLTIVRASRDESVPEFVESVLSALKRATLSGKSLSAQEERNLRERLADALKLDRTLGLAAKARDVVNEHEHSFCDGRILTDVRPVFMDKVADQPSAAAIVHTMKIAFHVAGELRDFYVAMNTRDLKRLRDQIERAEAKGVTMRALLKKSGIPYLGSE